MIIVVKSYYSASVYYLTTTKKVIYIYNLSIDNVTIIMVKYYY